MSFAYELGQTLIKQALLEELGETVVGGLNRIAPKSKPGLALATHGLSNRLNRIAAEYGGAGASEGRLKMIDALRARARASRMQAIGSGALIGGGGLTAAGVASDLGQKNKASE